MNDEIDFMGENFISIAILSSFQERWHNYRSFSQRCSPKKVKPITVFLAVSSQLHLYIEGTSEISTVKERSHIANAHLKIIRQDLKAFLEETKRQRYALKQLLKSRNKTARAAGDKLLTDHSAFAVRLLYITRAK